MGISPYMKGIREKIGSTLLLSPGVGALIRNEESSILLQKPRGAEHWSLPAGGIEPGETPAEAIVREVREETGLIVEPERVVALLGGREFRTTYPNGHRVEYHFAVFACRVTSGRLGGLDDETEELQFFPANDLPELTLPYPTELFTLSDSGFPIFR